MFWREGVTSVLGVVARWRGICPRKDKASCLYHFSSISSRALEESRLNSHSTLIIIFSPETLLRILICVLLTLTLCFSEPELFLLSNKHASRNDHTCFRMMFKLISRFALDPRLGIFEPLSFLRDLTLDNTVACPMLILAPIHSKQSFA